MENAISYGSSPVYTAKETSDSFIIIRKKRKRWNFKCRNINYSWWRQNFIHRWYEELNISKTENIESTQILDILIVSYADVKNTFHCPGHEESYSKSSAVP